MPPSSTRPTTRSSICLFFCLSVPCWLLIRKRKNLQHSNLEERLPTSGVTGKALLRSKDKRSRSLVAEKRRPHIASASGAALTYTQCVEPIRQTPKKSYHLMWYGTAHDVKYRTIDAQWTIWDINVTNGGSNLPRPHPVIFYFFSVCLESPENQVTQTPFRIKKEKFNIQNLTKDFLN